MYVYRLSFCDPQPDITCPFTEKSDLYMASLPFHPHKNTASCSEPAYLPFCPCGRKRRKHMDLSAMALQKYLRNSCRIPEVSVDLIGRVGTQKIGVDTASKKRILNIRIYQMEQIIDDPPHMDAVL